MFVAFLMAQLLLFVFDMKKLLEIRSFYHRALNISEVCCPPWVQSLQAVVSSHSVQFGRKLDTRCHLPSSQDDMETIPWSDVVRKIMTAQKRLRCDLN